MTKQTTFILAGNAPYENRGCEAIVRGTVNILREYFDNPKFLCISHFQSEEQYKKQCQQETDESIVHFATRRISKNELIKNVLKRDNWMLTYYYLHKRDVFFRHTYQDIIPHLEEAKAVLSIGGDSYSLDYGIPRSFVALDDLMIEKKKKIFIWGASVGPFSSILDYEQQMSQHLQKITGIFSRESVTTNYLQTIGVSDNVYPVADPAFLMESIKPYGIENEMSIEDDAIGINLSPLMSKFALRGNLQEWIKVAAAIITRIEKTTELPIYLIPHVTSPHSNDYDFMLKVLSLIEKRNKEITLIPPIYNAAETKWIISRMTLFAGARTHSTIAALSSNVPTISFSYSQKAIGINKDIFGHESYLIEPHNLTPNITSHTIETTLEESSKIREYLCKVIPKVQKRSLNAGSYLKTLLED